MDYKQVFYPESRFGGFTDLDATMTFYTRVRALVGPDSVLLDIGCGGGEYADEPVPARREIRIFRGRCRAVIGIDVDDAGRRNPFLDAFRLIEGTRWPVEDESVDLALCDYVLEHVADPDALFRECRRVVRPGGYLCIRTPNVLSYFGFFSALIPNRLHAAVVAKVQGGPRRQGVFPTLYRCNTRGKLRHMLRTHGFEGCVYGYEDSPSYLGFSKLFYWLGVLYQRLAPNAFKVNLFAFARRRP